MTLTKYIINESTKATRFSISNIEVFIKDTIQDPEVSVSRVIKTVVSKIPSHLMRKVKQIHVGQFEFLNSKDYEASYQNSKIFVTNKQSSEEDMIDDIIHEVAHSVRDIGYPVLSVLTASIFHSPYAATSLSEYFADGFEAFYMKEELGRLKSISPRLYKKIIGLSTINTGDYND